MWPWPRPRREVPQVNYNEDTEDEDDFEEGLQFDSPLQSPVRPLPSRAGSPVELAHPTLNDNVDEVLEEVNYHLGDIVQVEEEIDELVDLLADTNTGLGNDPLEEIQGVEEEVTDFHEEVDTGVTNSPADVDVGSEIEISGILAVVENFPFVYTTNGGTQ